MQHLDPRSPPCYFGFHRVWSSLFYSVIGSTMGHSDVLMSHQLLTQLCPIVFLQVVWTQESNSPIFMELGLLVPFVLQRPY